MSVSMSCNATLVPQPPVPTGVDGGGGSGLSIQSPTQSPMQVPTVGGGAADAQQAAQTISPAPGAQPAQPTNDTAVAGVSGGGDAAATQLASLVPAIQQLTQAVTALTESLTQARAGAAQAQSQPQSQTQPQPQTTATPTDQPQATQGGGDTANPGTPATSPASAAPTSAAGPATDSSVAGTSGAGVVASPAADPRQLVAQLQQIVQVVGQLVAALQAQAGAAGVAGGGATSGSGAGGAGTCGHCAAQAGATQLDAAVGGGGQVVQQTPMQLAPAKSSKKSSGKISSSLTAKGQKLTSSQRKNLEIVLQTGKEMGASKKVLETAVATVIQESNAHNDASVDSKDHDSLGLFQQRPSAGWGTRAQISDPVYAAKKFFEQAIPNDRKHPDYSHAQLAQSVQRSAFPSAYAQWDGEAKRIVASFNDNAV